MFDTMIQSLILGALLNGNPWLEPKYLHFTQFLSDSVVCSSGSYHCPHPLCSTEIFVFIM